MPETICSQDSFGGVCVLNPSAVPRNRKRNVLERLAAIKREEAELAEAAKAVALPGDEVLDL